MIPAVIPVGARVDLAFRQIDASAKRLGASIERLGAPLRSIMDEMVRGNLIRLPYVDALAAEGVISLEALTAYDEHHRQREAEQLLAWFHDWWPGANPGRPFPEDEYAEKRAAEHQAALQGARRS